MKTLVVIALIASATGCLGDPDGVEDTTEQAVAAPNKPGRCPDPLDCDEGNGGGVYTEEAGHAGFGPHDAMVAYFTNTTVGTLGAVTWRGRYRGSDGKYVYNSDAINANQIVKATYKYDGINYTVASVSESATLPTFVLRNNDGSASITVDADHLQDLHLQFGLFNPATVTTDWATMSFGARGTPPAGDPVQTYPIYWNTGTVANPQTWQPYCQGAMNGIHPTADYGVFQQGIKVDPLTAETAVRGEQNAVTLSCRKGAIATVRSWGYVYNSPLVHDQTLFEAAMHMKRASYCGDITTYTKGGIEIGIFDVDGIQAHSGITDDNVEARWGASAGGRIRALCINLDEERLTGYQYPAGKGAPFNGWCYSENLVPLYKIPSCRGASFPDAVVWDVRASTP